MTCHRLLAFEEAGLQAYLKGSLFPGTGASNLAIVNSIPELATLFWALSFVCHVLRLKRSSRWLVCLLSLVIKFLAVLAAAWRFQ